MKAAALPTASPSQFAETFEPGPTALLYHKIDYLKTGVLRRGLYVSPRIFAAQLAELQKAGMAPATATTIAGSNTDRPVLITFDDGFLDNLLHALPVLLVTRFNAINFLVADRLGQVNAWDLAEGERSAPLMDAAQVCDWLASGQEIGAHTLTHPHLPRLSRAAAREEISASKKSLEDRFARPVTDFAYPYGELNPALKDLVAEAGFLRAWTTEPGALTSETDPFALPRYPVMVSLRQPRNFWRSLPFFGQDSPFRRHRTL